MYAAGAAALYTSYEILICARISSIANPALRSSMSFCNSSLFIFYPLFPLLFFPKRKEPDFGSFPDILRFLKDDCNDCCNNTNCQNKRHQAAAPSSSSRWRRRRPKRPSRSSESRSWSARSWSKHFPHLLLSCLSSFLSYIIFVCCYYYKKSEI